MKVSVICPNCNQEVGIDGIKINIDGKTVARTDLKRSFKKYIGWGSGDKSNIQTAPTTTVKDLPHGEDHEDLEKALDQVVKKQAAPPPPFDEVVKPAHVGSPISITPTSTITTSTAQPTNTVTVTTNTQPTTNIPEKPVVTPKPTEPIPLPPATEDATITKQLTKMGDDIHTIAEAFRREAVESKKKGICPICNKNPGIADNLICNQCLDEIIRMKARHEHEKVTKKLIW